MGAAPDAQERASRDGFIGRLSHELRTPITSIYAAAAVLRTRDARLDEALRIELLEDIMAESDRLRQHIDDLLIFLDPEPELVPRDEPNLLQHVVPPVVAHEQQRRPDVELRLQVEPDLPVVHGDDSRIRQVARNLIFNAIRMGGSRPVVIELGLDGEAEGVAVRLFDEGRTIDAARSAALFEPFESIDRARDETPGLGLELYVARRMVEAMGGHIWARPGRKSSRRSRTGNEFGFWLPRFR